MKEELKKAIEHLRAAQLESSDPTTYGKLDDLMHAVQDVIDGEG